MDYLPVLCSVKLISYSSDASSQRGAPFEKLKVTLGREWCLGQTHMGPVNVAWSPRTDHIVSLFMLRCIYVQMTKHL